MNLSFVILDAIETGKDKSAARKRKEIKNLENFISNKQEQLEKLKTELSTERLSKLCDEDDFLFLELSDKNMEAPLTVKSLSSTTEGKTNSQEHVESGYLSDEEVEASEISKTPNSTTTSEI